MDAGRYLTAAWPGSAGVEFMSMSKDCDFSHRIFLRPVVNITYLFRFLKPAHLDRALDPCVDRILRRKDHLSHGRTLWWTADGGEARRKGSRISAMTSVTC